MEGRKEKNERRGGGGGERERERKEGDKGKTAQKDETKGRRVGKAGKHERGGGGSPTKQQASSWRRRS
jgi:hypothetical protein